VETNKTYVTATKTTEYRTYDGDYWAAQGFLLELTPVGIVAPLFGYPHKSYAYTGTFNIHTDPAEAESRIRDASSFTIDGQSGSCKILLDFTKGVDDALRTTGRSIEYSPESIELTVTCVGVACQVTAKPDVVFSDGLVRLESREVLNQQRLDQIAEAEAAAKRKQKEAEEKERPARELENARNRCLNAMVYGGEYSAQLEQFTQMLRDIVRARERGVEIDSDGQNTAGLCKQLANATKQLDRFVPDLESCDEVAHSLLREQDEIQMRAEAQSARSRALWSKEAALGTQRSLCAR
jgi:hypothetical protein